MDRAPPPEKSFGFFDLPARGVIYLTDENRKRKTGHDRPSRELPRISEAMVRAGVRVLADETGVIGPVAARGLARAVFRAMVLADPEQYPGYDNPSATRGSECCA